MSQNRIETHLERKIGLSTKALSRDTLARVIRDRVRATGAESVEHYATLVMTCREEEDQLIESVVVPETWFFRNPKAFEYMVQYVQKEWSPQRPSGVLRLLSIPCSSGEEPYSMAMALLDGGFSRERFHIDAVDVSPFALEKARAGFYGEGSFRGQNLSFRRRYFESQEGGFQIRPDVKSLVHFQAGNILDQELLPYEKPYDLIFCRNLLIYLSTEAKEKALQALERLLARDGVLFLGHAERQAVFDRGFAAILYPGAFACRRERRSVKREPGNQLPTGPGQRIFERAAASVLDLPAQRGTCQPTTIETLLDGKDEKGPNAHSAPVEEKDLFAQVQRLADTGVLPQALQLCGEFLHLHPTHAQAHFLMGLIYEAVDEESEAECCFNRALYLDPNHHEALTHLSFIMINRGKEAEASHLRKRARRILERRGQAQGSRA